MAKTVGPLLSLGARGSIAKTAVFSKWRGIPYVRQHVIPANPNSVGQQATRNVFRTMTEMWKLMPTVGVDPWDLFATGRPFLGRNAYIGQNVAAMRGEVDQDLAVGSPGARGGIPFVSFAPTTIGANAIECNVTDPVEPVGWSIVNGIGLAWPDQDPAVAFVGPFGSISIFPTAGMDITGLATGNHQVRVWLEWTKPDTTTAYSVALADQIVVT